jgi:hypothetical protein
LLQLLTGFEKAVALLKELETEYHQKMNIENGNRNL